MLITSGGGVLRTTSGGAPVSSGSSQSLLALTDLAFTGAFGAPSAGPSDGTPSTNNTFNYAAGLSFLRDVGGETRVVMPTWPGIAISGLDQDWRLGDLVEMSIPATLSTSRAGINTTLQEATSTRRWLKADWQGIGTKESASGVLAGGCWWDETNDILWYQVFPYYDASACAHLYAVKLHDPVSGTIGTCTRYGPWWYGSDWTTADWKRVFQFLIPIPADKQAELSNRTHLVGGSVMSVGGASHWGIGLCAINLPTLFEEISGDTVAGTSGSNVITITDAAHDLSVLVPTDGSAAFYVAFSDAQAAIYTVPSSIVKAGNDYTITGSKTLTAGQAAALPCRWSVVKHWGDSGVQLADFSNTAGPSWPDYFQKRPDDYTNIQGVDLLSGDPYLKVRTGLGSSSITDPQVSKHPQAVGTTTITLDATASATNDQYVGQFITWADAYLSYAAIREITAYNGTTKVATLDTAFDPAYTPTTGSTYTIKTPYVGDLSSWDTPSAAIPNSGGGEGYWCGSADCPVGAVFLSSASKHGLLMFGRQSYGSIWYHFWDTYGYFDKVALGWVTSAGSYGYCATNYRPIVWQYNPTHLAESAAGSRVNTRAGMEVSALGSWYDLTGSLVWPLKTATGYESEPLEARTFWMVESSGGNNGSMMWDEANSRLIWVYPQNYHPGGDYGRPLFLVFDVTL